MAWKIVKQPNGKYARWSDIVDDFTHLNMSRSEAIEECKTHPGMGALEAEAKVARADRDEIYIEPNVLSHYGDGTERWQECIATMGDLGKTRVAKAREREAGVV